jgi:hypothetical protein
MARRIEKDTFHLQQGPLHRKTTLIATQCSIGANGAVARYDYRKGVRCQCCAYGPRSVGITKMPGDPLIGAHPAPGNSMFSAKDLLLKPRTEIHADIDEREADVFARQECCNPVGDMINLCAGRRSDPGKGYPDNLSSRRVWLRDHDTQDFRLFPMD